AINGWNLNCERCHTPAHWEPRGFNHDFFPLQGGHAGVDCSQCHAGGRVANAPNDCYQCHRRDYLAAPNHVSENRSTDCTECHDIFGFDN
ncbi:MAG: cytochrome c3 family protein, partial [Planctomycetota bacterium]